MRFYLGPFLLLAACAPRPVAPVRQAPPRWCAEERPVYVVVSRALGAECLATVNDAVTFWNVGYLAVLSADDASVPRTATLRLITVTGDSPEADNAGGDARPSRLTPSCLGSSSVRLRTCRRQTVFHELGHALGLPHHPSPDNVMYWHAFEHVDGPYGVDDAQRAHIR